MPPRPPVDLVIFDCDGVLVDSEPLSMRIATEVLAEQGAPMSMEEAYRLFLGRSEAHLKATVAQLFNLTLTAEIMADMRSRLVRLFEAELQPIDGVHDALDRLAHRRCVASSSSPERIGNSLRRTRLDRYFGADVFSATMVKNGKPAPDLFLFAAERMGVVPDRCLVIEDSPAGIAAAKSAGMPVFAFTGATHGQVASHQQAIAEAAADLVFGDMRQLPGLLAEQRLP